MRLARVLWDRPPGFYVDVGAGDPVSNSVTRLFYDAGWHGINIEPGPAFAQLEFARPRDVNLRLVVGTQAGERDFWVCRPNTELSSLLPLDPSSLPPGNRVDRERIQCRRLDAILEEHTDAAIEFLKVDVEGAEGDVLESIDLRRFRPLVLVVEAIDPQTRRPSHEQWQPRVLGSGYLHAAFDGVNRYYVPEERSELCEVLGYPLTPLDNFVPVALDQRTDAIPGHGRRPSPGPHHAGKEERSEAPLTVILDGVEDSGLVSRVVPRGSSLLALRATSVQRSGETDATRRYPATLEGLGHAVRAEPRYDVLIVSDAGALTRSGLDELRSTLATDSACTTASARDGANHTTRTLPPASVGPRRGVVLVRCDDLVLGLDEARLLARGDVGLLSLPDEADLVDELLASLVRPGFVHRLCGRAEQAEPDEPRPALRHAGQPVRDVVVDARCLGHPLSGTQVNVLGLLGGIVRAGANVSVLVPRDVHPTVSPNLVALRKAMPFIERVGPGRPTVFHRPFQIGSLKVLAACLSMGERLVLTHLDMIPDRTPGYAGSTASWERYRSVTSAALSSADGLGFLSHHTANDAASDGVLDLDRVAVIHPGVDHLGAMTDGPVAVAASAGGPTSSSSATPTGTRTGCSRFGCFVGSSSIGAGTARSCLSGSIPSPGRRAAPRPPSWTRHRRSPDG